MSRRDTILVAVLINAGLLAVLFATAVNRDPHSDQQTMPVAMEEPAKETEVVHTASTPILPVKDEGDRALARYRESIQQSKPEPKKTEVAAAPAPVKEEKAPEVAPTKEEKGFVEVTVKRGDVLERIARANRTTVKAIMDANNLSGTNLRIGQVLRVPLDQLPKQPASREIASVEVSDDYYIVQIGDNPWSIARKHGLDLDELKSLNDLDEARARRLKPGDKLRLR